MSQNHTPTLMLTVPEAAKECRMSEGYIKKAIRERQLTARKFGRATRIERSALESWISRQPMKIVVNTSDDCRSLTENDTHQPTEKTVSVSR